MLPSDAGGSSTPFLVPPVFGRRSDPKGLVPRLVQRTVHSGAHAPARPRIPIPPPLTCDRKVTNRPGGASEPVLITGTRTARKKIQKNLRSMATKRVPHESYWLYGPARAGRRAIHLPLEAVLFFRGCPPSHITVMCDSPLVPARVFATKPSSGNALRRKGVRGYSKPRLRAWIPSTNPSANMLAKSAVPP